MVIISEIPPAHRRTETKKLLTTTNGYGFSGFGVRALWFYCDKFIAVVVRSQVNVLWIGPAKSRPTNEKI